MNVKSFFMTFWQLLFSLSMYALGIFFFGLALCPAVIIFFKVWSLVIAENIWLRSLAVGFAIGLGYFVFGFGLIVLSGLTRTIFRLKLREGNHKIFSLEALKWAFASSLYLIINFTFIDFILLTPFANLLQRLLGARLGSNVQINSKFVFDSTLLEIGDNTVVGGGAIIIGHVVERGILKLKKVKIGKNVTIGSHATIMPGCEIGDNAIIGAGAVLLKNTKIEPHSVWYGVPAENIRNRHNHDKEE
ncbi:MAG: DapH/DapD/GlmU-related protein [Candidatus Omnitrophica bacterium]|nr:DapH/DapD/GlmU-related protein [Candidatus Omnitrophota bacterium]